jgi:glycosyltransferase involved in cell wall biosynthesis
MRILFCGQSGIPSNKNATLNRYTSIAKAMSSENEIIFINRIPLLNKNEPPIDFEFQLIEASGIKYRPDNFFKRSLLKILAPFYEFKTFRHLNKQKKIDWVNVYTPYFGICLFYYFLSKIFHFKTILHYVEKRSEFKDPPLILFNHILFDRFAPSLFDRIIPISKYLNDLVKDKNPKAKTIIIPPICDFEYFKSISSINLINEKYFVYCASTAYEEVIKFVIMAFKKLESKDVKLVLILNGNISQDLIKAIENSHDKIRLYTKLEYNELISIYKNALALLVPLRNNKQDAARFPQKISEYLASEKIFISTKVGEVHFYFQDKVNAVLAEEYNIDQFSEKMDWVTTHIEDLYKIEKKAYQTGNEFFNLNSYIPKLNEFLK